jgi:hypothetical protein
MLDLNVTVTGMRLAGLPLTKQKICIFNITFFACNCILFTEVHYQHDALHYFIIS